MSPAAQTFDIRLHTDPGEIDAIRWDALVASQAHPSPFMRHAYFKALHDAGCATADTGWVSAFFTCWEGDRLVAACPLYVKSHSYGEYVFDWAWANAYAQHGLDYYPKALVAVPFTPVPGTRLLASDAVSRATLVHAMVQWCKARKLSSLHLLFGSQEDIQACQAEGLMLRSTVQFHWGNRSPDRYADFDDFLAELVQEKRKKIKQERRKVAQAGIVFRSACGNAISSQDWDFFYRCYERTYYEHGNAPYLTRDFFHRMAAEMPENWLLFVAEREGKPVACSLVGIALNGSTGEAVAYGRYWGALERIDCLHFEACYYQPIAWCIANGYDRFEGGAQGEHKMARALLPVATHSAHWIARPDFADAIENFLGREDAGISRYLDHLQERSPLRDPGSRNSPAAE